MIYDVSYDTRGLLVLLDNLLGDIYGNEKVVLDEFISYSSELLEKYEVTSSPLKEIETPKNEHDFFVLVYKVSSNIILNLYNLSLEDDEFSFLMAKYYVFRAVLFDKMPESFFSDVFYSGENIMVQGFNKIEDEYIFGKEE